MPVYRLFDETIVGADVQFVEVSADYSIVRRGSDTDDNKYLEELANFIMSKQTFNNRERVLIVRESVCRGSSIASC